MGLESYKGFKLRHITKPEFRHLWLLLYWPLYALSFFLLERMAVENYRDMYCPLDDIIPFCEYFLVPYCLWYFLLGWIVLYTMLHDIPMFKKYHTFILITCSITLLFYFLCPNMQSLRPTEFPRDNIFTHGVKFLYSIDTNTNVCPSLHVIFSFGILFTCWHSRRFGTPMWRVIFTVAAILISLSTVFIKQHSVVDLVAGVAFSLAVYPFVFLRKNKKEKQKATA